GLIGRRPGRAGGNAFYPSGKPLPPPSSRDSVTIVQHVQFQPLARRPTSGSRAGWWHLDCKTGVGTWDAHHIELEDDLVRIRLLPAGLALAAAVLLGAPTSFATPFPPGTTFSINGWNPGGDALGCTTDGDVTNCSGSNAGPNNGAFTVTNWNLHLDTD